jgi:hypothetical protein
MTDDLGPVEDRLRRALTSRADAVEPRAGDVAVLEARAEAARATHRRRLTLLSLAAALAVIAAVAGLLVAVSDDDPEELATESPTTTTAPTTSSTTTSTSTSTTVLQDDGVPGWPGATARVFDNPGAAALNFVTDVLGFAEPHQSSSEGNDVTDASFTFNPRPTASIATVVDVHNTGPIRGWVVTGARSEQGTIDEFSFDGTTVTLSGSATAFEATVAVLVLDQEGNVLAESFTMAGANGEMGPYQTTIDVDPGAGTPFWVMIGEGDASGEGDMVWAATATL